MDAFFEVQRSQQGFLWLFNASLSLTKCMRAIKYSLVCIYVCTLQKSKFCGEKFSGIIYTKIILSFLLIGFYI